MDHHDMTGDGVKDLIVGRDGGAIQVYSYEDGDEMEPTLRFTTVCVSPTLGRERATAGLIVFQNFKFVSYSTFLIYVVLKNT